MDQSISERQNVYPVAIRHSLTCKRFYCLSHTCSEIIVTLNNQRKGDFTVSDNIDAVLDRVRKLLALGEDKGASENEAAIALKRARSLIDKHQINEIDLIQDKPMFEEAVSSQPPSKATPLWQQTLAIAVARFNDCRVAKSPDHDDFSHRPLTRIYFLGLVGDATTAVHMYDYLMQNGKLLAAEYLDANPGNDVDQRRHDFKYAYAQALKSRIEQLIIKRDQELDQVNQSSSNKSLVVIKKDLLEGEYGKEKYRSRPVDPKRIFTEAATEGYMAGMKTKIQREINEDGETS